MLGMDRCDLLPVWFDLQGEQPVVFSVPVSVSVLSTN